MQLLGLYAATKVKVAIENFHATFTYSFHCSVDYPYRDKTGTQNRNSLYVRAKDLP